MKHPITYLENRIKTLDHELSCQRRLRANRAAELAEVDADIKAIEAKLVEYRQAVSVLRVMEGPQPEAPKDEANA